MDKINLLFKNYRIAKGITQEELAQLSGVSLPTIKNFERGADIKLNTLDKLLNSVGLEGTLDHLIPDITDRPSYRAKYEKNQLRQRVRKKVKDSEWSWGE